MHNITFQLDRPYLHRANAAEQAIRTAKAYIKAILASIDPKFPVTVWDRLIPQIEITLNLLPASRVNPRLLTYAYLNSNYDYNITLLVPMGMKVISYLKTDNKSTWSFNGEEGWTVPAFNLGIPLPFTPS